ncbi:MAG: phage tail length tape measure family protein [Rhizomicrobium sp.]
MGVSLETIRRITIQATETGVSETTAGLNQLSAAYGGVSNAAGTTATVTDISSKRSLSAADAYARQSLTVIEGARQQDLFQRAMRVTDAAFQQGIINADQYGMRVQQLAQKYSSGAVATNAFIATQLAAARAVISANQGTLQGVQSEQAMEALRQQAQISTTGLNLSLARSNALMRDAVSAEATLRQSKQQLIALQQQYNAQLASQPAAPAQTQFQQNLNTRLGVKDDFDAAGRAQDIQAYGAALDQLQTKFDPLYAASKRYEQEIEAIEAAQRAGAFTAEGSYIRAIEHANASYAASAAPLATMAGKTKLSASEMTNLSYQLNDVASGLAMGQSPFMILTQQGGQFVQIMQQSGVGPVGIIKQVGGLIGSFITPAVLAGGALLGVGAAVAYIAYEAISNGKAMESALTGVGRGAGVTASGLDALAVAGAHQGNIGVGAARGYAEAYASTGRIVGGQIQQLTALTENYAATTRQDADAAVKELSTSFSDLSKGVDTLNAKTGFLDAATRQHIIDLEAQGDHAAAVKATIDALQPSLIKYGENLTWLGRRWHDIKTFGSDVVEFATHAPNTKEQLDAAQEQLDAVKNAGGMMFVNGMPLYQAGAQAEVDRLGKQLAIDTAKAGKDGHDALLRNLSLSADDISKALNPGIDQINNALNNRNLLVTAQKAGWPNMTPDQKARGERGLAQDRGMIGSLADPHGDLHVQNQTFLSDTQLRIKSLQLETQAIYAKTPAQKADLAMQQSLLQTAGQAVDPAERMTLAQLASTNAYATASKAIRDQIDALHDNVTASSRSAQAWIGGAEGASLMAKSIEQAESAVRQGGGPSVMQFFTQAVAQQVDSAAQAYGALQRQAQAQREANSAVAAGTIGYGQISTFVQQRVRDLGLEALRAEAVTTGNKDLLKSVDALAAGYKGLDKQTEQDRLKALTRPITSPYQDDLDRLNDLKKGGLSGADLRRGMADTGLMRDLEALQSQLAQLNPFGRAAGGVYDDSKAQLLDGKDKYSKAIDAAKDNGLISEQRSLDLRAGLEDQYRANSLAAWTKFEDEKLALGQTTFDSLATGLGDMFGKQSAAYKIAFGIEKAFQIARTALALEVAVAQAMTLPWPENIPAIAQAIALGGQIMSEIASINGQGFLGGGYTGNGPIDRVSGVVHGQEFVAHAQATAANRATLTAMNAGVSFDKMFARQVAPPANYNAAPTVKVTVNAPPGMTVKRRQLGDEEIIDIIDAKSEAAVYQHAGKALESELASRNSRGAGAVRRLVNPKS